MKRKVLALFLVLVLALAMGSMTVSAKPGDENDTGIIVDDFNRDEYYDNRIYTTGVGTIYWQEKNENVIVDDNNALPIKDGVLELEYKADMWWAISSTCSSSAYDYLCFRVKGEAGGEEEHLSLKFGDGDYKDIGVSGQDKLSSFVTADGSAPKITTEWTTIVIDMNKSDIVEKSTGKTAPMLKTFNGIHLNSSAAGKIYIDCIWFSTDAKADEAPDGEYLKAEEEKKTEAAGNNEKVETTVAAKEDKGDDNAEPVTEAKKEQTPIKLGTDEIIFYCLIAIAVIIGIICIVITLKNKAPEVAESETEKAEEKVEAKEETEVETEEETEAEEETEDEE